MDGLHKFAMNILLSLKRQRRLGEGNTEEQVLEAELFSCKKGTALVSKSKHKSISYNRYMKKYNCICYYKIYTKIQIQVQVVKNIKISKVIKEDSFLKVCFRGFNWHQTRWYPSRRKKCSQTIPIHILSISWQTKDTQEKPETGCKVQVHHLPPSSRPPPPPRPPVSLISNKSQSFPLLHSFRPHTSCPLK